MSLKPEVLDAMVAAGCTAEQIAAVVKASMPSRSSNAERQARYRARHRNDSNVTERNGDACDVTPPSPSLPPQTPPSRPHPPVGIIHAREGTDLEAEFEEFWSLYPHKVGRLDTQAKFLKARRSTPQSVILAGLGRYVASKPADRHWCNPANWLDQNRWADEPAPEPSRFRVVHGNRGSPRTSGSDLMVETAAQMLSELQGGGSENEHWNQGRTIDGHSQRR